MRNIIIVLWVILVTFFAAPIVANFVSGVPAEEIPEVIQKEAETDQLEITGAEEEGNKAMYTFNAGKDFGVAVFVHYADNYSYDEGAMANGEKYIDVSLDTGWDVYQYKVTRGGPELVGVMAMSGSYRMYIILAAVLAVITIGGAIFSRIKKNKPEKTHR